MRLKIAMREGEFASRRRASLAGPGGVVAEAEWFGQGAMGAMGGSREGMITTTRFMFAPPGMTEGY